MRHASVFPVPAGTGGRTLFVGEEGKVVVQGVGVNYANKCSDTNLDEDPVKEELAEGGIVRMMAAAAAVVGGASPHTSTSLPTPCSLP